MKILVTGVTGFVGGHLAEFLAVHHPEIELHGTARTLEAPHYMEFLKGRLRFHECDIDDKRGVEKTISDVFPDVIIHLAAQSYVNSSWERPEATLHTNIIGQSNVFEAVRGLMSDAYNPTILIACSSEEYGFHAPVGGFTEASPLRPHSPYALSKVAQDYMGYQYWSAYGMKIIRIRAFNHTGPRRDPVFGVSGFCRKVVEIEKGMHPPQLETRDLTAVRDFTDVRDVVQAYWLAIERCRAGEVYNVCSGKGVSFREIINVVTSLSRVQPITLVPDPKGVRPTDGGVIIGNNKKFCQATGWQPHYDFLHQTIPDIVEYWRGNLT
ncbi:MAG: GDP-mannose 4,6-dehydratase [Patescibacteria group bacterium]